MKKENLEKKWDREGSVESSILMGDLYKTYSNLSKLVCLAQLSKIVVSNEKVSIVIPKEKPEEMIHKVLWLSSILNINYIQAVKEDNEFKLRTNSLMTFEAYNDLLKIKGGNPQYKPLDSHQRS